MAYIQKEKLYQYFLSNYKVKSSTHGWKLFECPYCDWDDKTGAFHLKSAKVKCFRGCMDQSIVEFVQDQEGLSEGEALTFLRELEPVRLLGDELDGGFDEEKQVRLTSVNITLPEGFNSLLSGEGSMAKRARNYLKGRGFDLEELDAKGFGYCDKHHKEFLKDFHGYIIVPFKQEGRLVYYLGRDYYNNSMRYKNPPAEFVGVGKSDVIYNEEALSLYKEIFVLEGWSDAETIGKRATATLGWSMSNHQKNRYFTSPTARRLIFMPDAGFDGQGESFYKKATKLGMEFLDSGKKVFIVNPNNEELQSLGKDANEIGKQAMLKAYHETEPLTFSKAIEILST